MIQNPLLYYHTIRFLKPEQILNRFHRSILKHFYDFPSIQEEIALKDRKPSLPTLSGNNQKNTFDGKKFNFLNQTIPFEGNNCWEPKGASKLWIYNLHYFKYIHTLDSRLAYELITNWIKSQTSIKRIGWEPYPISIRVREWIEWLESNPELPENEKKYICKSIVIQVEILKKFLEYHLLGNHLLENAITLCWAGVSLDCRYSKEWIITGKKILSKQLKEQILDDGTHEERSPMYQAILAESLLRLAEVAQKYNNSDAKEIFELSLNYGKILLNSLKNLVHPDGGYALLNDTASGVAPSYSEIVKRFSNLINCNEQYSLQSKPFTWNLDDAGYMGYYFGQGSYFVFDAGPIGPDHQPGHGHADMLSFELSHKNRRIFTDTGIFTYENNEKRLYDRGTKAHNTIQIDNRNQSEIWSAFRCGKRARILEKSLYSAPESVSFYGSYKGIGEFFGKKEIHRREICFKGKEILFHDSISFQGNHTARLRLHIAPELKLKRKNDSIEIYDGTEKVATVLSRNSDWNLEDSPYHPDFGIEITRACLVSKKTFNSKCEFIWSIILE